MLHNHRHVHFLLFCDQCWRDVDMKFHQTFEKWKKHTLTFSLSISVLTLYYSICTKNQDCTKQRREVDGLKFWTKESEVDRSLLLYHRYPKCGSSTFNLLLKTLAKAKNFTHRHLHYSKRIKSKKKERVRNASIKHLVARILALWVFATPRLKVLKTNRLQFMTRTTSDPNFC